MGKALKVRITLLEEALGGSPSNEDLLGTYIASKATSIAKSESVPEGSTIEFSVVCLDPALEKMVKECLDYGTMRGLGQWRNSGKGRFVWDLLDGNGRVIGGNNEFEE